MLFAAMGEEIREHFRVGAIEDAKEGCRERLCTAVSSNDEVLFHWCLVRTQSEEAHTQTVFDMLVSIWITVRGFTFASTCTFVEMYKQEKRSDYNGPRHLENTSIRHDLPHSIH